MDQILYRNICLVEQPFFSKATNGYLWNFSFLDLFMHLVSNFTRKDTILSKLTEFGHQDSLRAVSILLYFISFRAWIENFHMINNLMVIMPSYFCKDKKDKT